MERVCRVCGRGRFTWPKSEEIDHTPCREKVTGGKVYYAHDYYGCESGCCGHRIYVTDVDGEELFSNFLFEHHKETLDELVKEIAFELGIDVGKCEHCDYC